MTPMSQLHFANLSGAQVPVPPWLEPGSTSSSSSSSSSVAAAVSVRGVIGTGTEVKFKFAHTFLVLIAYRNSAASSIFFPAKLLARV